MSTVTIVLLVILAVLIVGLIVLYFLGKKAQKKPAFDREPCPGAVPAESLRHRTDKAHFARAVGVGPARGHLPAVTGINRF